MLTSSIKCKVHAAFPDAPLGNALAPPRLKPVLAPPLALCSLPPWAISSAHFIIHSSSQFTLEERREEGGGFSL